MMRSIILAAFAVLVCAMPARAANCHWTPAGYVCAPGWMWQEGREWSDHEWRERHQHHEERERGGDWSRHYHYDERH